jgi:hypothetical protein
VSDEQFQSGVETEAEEPEIDQADQPVETDQPNQPDQSDRPDQPDQPEQPTRSRPMFAVGRALVVLIAGVIVYQFVVPSTHYVPSRISRLVVTDTGLSQFAGKKPQSGIQDASQSGLDAITSAVKKAPHQTGVYSTQWTASQTAGAVVAAFVLPNSKNAQTTQSQFQKQQMSPSAYTNEGLTRKSTGSISRIPGGVQALYGPSTKGSGSPDLGVAVSQVGRVVAVVEVAGAASAQADAQSLATAEYSHLTKVVPGFSFSKVDRPALASGLWAGATVLLALLAALVPIGWGRWNRGRRRRHEEELSHQVQVGSQVIYKYRR